MQKQMALLSAALDTAVSVSKDTGLDSSDPFAACVQPNDSDLVREESPISDLFPESDSCVDQHKWLPPQDPFKGSQLSGFGLSAVGAALAHCRPSDAPEDRECSLWTLVRAGGGQRPGRVPWD